ncbi:MULTISPECIES: hypothetical protein [Flavobacteriaceae]|uniref:Uncharacterized protein n=2 Tax=Flavobacteriaceae TaxID=49546 RepID=A0A4Y8AT53_9FLAO|nr:MULTISPECIES: hypothetical protein [Flavobacteriaceae]TEW75065.1 hypothetical protein E2488_05950 [Gramella jeungdoensis]GGK41931.1 hypothetical protein GCM10007963_07380 [Lutibacter litoralis]
MATQSKPTIHFYKEVNKGKFKSVKHFELAEVTKYEPPLSKLLNISKNRNCALSMPEFWLKIRQGNKWSKCITGLFNTDFKNIYKGDVNKRTHLVIFKFNDKVDTLTVYHFKNYFTTDLSKVLSLINKEG